MKRPTTYQEAVKIKYPEISVTKSPFDSLLTAVILELAFLDEKEGKVFWNKYKKGEITESYFDL